MNNSSPCRDLYHWFASDAPSFWQNEAETMHWQASFHTAWNGWNPAKLPTSLTPSEGRLSPRESSVSSADMQTRRALPFQDEARLSVAARSKDQSESVTAESKETVKPE